MKHRRAVAIAGAIRVQAAPTRITDSVHQFRILETKTRGKQNGIPDCNWRRGDDDAVRCDHCRLFETPRVAISRCQRLRSAARLIIIRRYLRAKFGWRLAENAFEHPVELRERLKTDIVSHFTDAAVRIQQLCAGIF